MDFKHKLHQAIEHSGGYVCVGLDPDLKRIPQAIKGNEAQRFIQFNREIINSTSAFTAAFKLNLAFYEAYGEQGWAALKETIAAIPNGKIIIGDGKRGDIGNSARFYAQALFSQLGCDAATVNPYMGADSIEPFITDKSKGAFVLTLTSNPGAYDFQLSGDETILFEKVAFKAKSLNKLGNVGLVVGATKSEYFQRLRNIAPDMPFLIPGVGAQGGDLKAVVNDVLKGFPGGGLINSSRGVIYASNGEDFAAAAAAACKLRDEINRHLVEN